MRFQVVRSSNQYEVNDVGSEQKRQIVEIKILDVLYDNQVCKLVYLRDITKLQNQLRETHQRTVAAEKVQSHTIEFLEDPRRFVNSAIEIFKKKHGKNLNETFDENVNTLIDSAMRFKEQYDNVSPGQDRSSICSGPIKAGKPEKFNIREFFEKVVRESAKQQRKKSLKINTNIDMTIPMEAFTQTEPLFQAITSSLRQAIKSVKHLGRFDISLNSELSMVKIKKFTLLIDFDWQTEDQTNVSMTSSARL